MSALNNVAACIVELKLTGDFVLPLQDHKVLEEHDFMAYLTGHMTKLVPGELVAYQIVAMSVYKNTHRVALRQIHRIQSRIARNKELSSELSKQRNPLGYTWWLMWYPTLWVTLAMFKITAALFDIVFTMMSDGPDLPMFMQGNRDRRKASNPYERELGTLIKGKLDQHLYEVTIRILVASPDKATIERRLDAIVSSFRPFTSTYQSFGVRKHVPFLHPSGKQLDKFKARTLSPHHLSQQTILSSSELSDLYHFPNTDMVKTEGFVKSRSRELVAPLSIAQFTRI